MIVFKGRAMVVSEAGDVEWVQLPKDPRQKQAARSQLESAQYAGWATKVLCQSIGRHPLGTLDQERFDIIAHYQQMSAMYSAIARDKMT